MRYITHFYETFNSEAIYNPLCKPVVPSLMCIHNHIWLALTMLWIWYDIWVLFQSLVQFRWMINGNEMTPLATTFLEAAYQQCQADGGKHRLSEIRSQIHWWFVHSNHNSMIICFYWYITPGKCRGTKFCICYDSPAVILCAKFHLNQFLKCGGKQD